VPDAPEWVPTTAVVGEACTLLVKLVRFCTSRGQGHNVFKRAYVQLIRRTAFMATPPKIWVFLLILGLFSALSLYVAPCTHAPMHPCTHAPLHLRTAASIGDAHPMHGLPSTCVGLRTTACSAPQWISSVYCATGWASMYVVKRCVAQAEPLHVRVMCPCR
jgi:hypothetical protein